MDFSEFDIPSQIKELISKIDIIDVAKATVLIGIGFFVASFVRSIINKTLSKYSSAHYTLLISRLFYWLTLTIFMLIVSSLFGVDISDILWVIVWASSFLTIAIGFAARTPVANIVSSVFLVFERPFSVGDYLDVDGIQGEILSIDLLSVKMRTRDNVLFRIPNEQLIKSTFKNLTKFPIRRIDLLLRIEFDQDLEKLKKVLFDLAKQDNLVLASPAPSLFFEEFSESACVFKFAIWTKQDSFFEVKNSMPLKIQKSFKDNNINMAVQQTKLHLSAIDEKYQKNYNQ